MTGAIVAEGVVLRPAEAGDAAAVAALHAASWRAAYRGILSDAFLDGPIEVERLALWRGRLEASRPHGITTLAEVRGDLVGFSCLVVDEDPRWGSYVNNLHADPAHRGRGVGRGLMREVAARATPGRPLHLLCLEGNGPARRFYGSLGGAAAETIDVDEPDGRRHPCIRYVWDSPAALAGACG